MDNKYRVILSGKKIYKEIELFPESTLVKFGTGIDCDVRVRKDMLLAPLEISFTKTDGQWSARCSDDYYFYDGSAAKLAFKNLKHGDTFIIKYHDSELDAFILDFMLDFEGASQNYDKVIDLGSAPSISIGARAHNDIILTSTYSQNENITLSKRGSDLILNIQSTNYGIKHNGSNASNGEVIYEGDFISIADYSFYYKKNRFYTQSNSGLQIPSLSNGDITRQGNYPMFNRNTRIKNVINDEKIEILDPPNKPQKPKENLLTRLLPSLGMLLAAGIMALMGSAMMLIFSGISAVMAIVTAVITLKQRNKEYEEGLADRINKYNAYVENKRIDIENFRNIERQELEEKYISQDIEKARMNSFSSDLFDKTPDDEDFLCLRLGTGNIISNREISYKKQERLEIEDDLVLIPEQMCEYYKYLASAPVTCSLKETKAIGVVGSEPYRYEIFKNILIDITARHYYGDVKTLIVAAPEHADRVYGLRMLPHLHSDILDGRLLVTDEDSKTYIFEYLYKELSFREQKKDHDNHIVVFLYDEFGFKNHPVSQFVEKAVDLGVTFVFFGDTRADILQGCSHIIDIQDANNAILIDTEDKSKSLSFIYPHIDDASLLKIVNFLAPVYTEEISLEGSLVKSFSLFQMLNILAVDDINLDALWGSSKVYESMSVPIGVSKTGIVTLNLHDKADGPHGLVAGTTGSGKSELLQTYILSMATVFHPYEVGFVIIDFKGGGMANQFEGLPHLLGTITNLEGKEIDRSLKSIKAELQKRQRLFASADVNHIDKYIKKYKANEVSEPLPHLIIIVDEFAELKAEQPDFMKELISAARIGRSLGVHLILATQKPSGQVNEQIWSNSRFKLCLKVQDQSDSNEVIKSPLAAEIKEPGRAYLQVGNNERFELFQSAFSGAPEKNEGDNTKEFKVAEITKSGRRKVVFARKKAKSEEESKTQLDAIVEYINEHCKTRGISKLSDICLPPLSTNIPYPEDCIATEQGIPIGIFDDPENQRQDKMYLDINSKNTMILGSSQFGKTNLLQNIIRGIAENYSPAQANIYIIDFASMFLKNFEGLNHVGGVVTSSEDEKLKNLFKLLFEEVSRRKAALLKSGVSSFGAYLEAGYTDLPRIYLIIDNITALIELYMQDDESLLVLTREGATVGITTIVANSQTAGVGYKYFANFANKIAFFCNDTNCYTSLFDRITIKPDEMKGRCVATMDKQILDCQIYHSFSGAREIDKVEDIRAFVSKMNSRYEKTPVKHIPYIPAVLTMETVNEMFTLEQSTDSIALGVRYDEVAPFYMDFTQQFLLGLCGKEGTGHHNFVKNMFAQFKANGTNTKIYIFDDVKRNLAMFKDAPGVASYTLETAPIAEILTECKQTLEEKYSAMMSGTEVSDEIIILLIQNNEVAKLIQSDLSVLGIYNDIASLYKSMGICFIFTNYENATVPYDSPEPIKQIRQQQKLIFFEDITNIKPFDPPYEAIKANRKKLERGDAFYINGNDVIKLKMIKGE